MRRKYRIRGWLLLGLSLLSTVVWSQPASVSEARAVIDTVAKTGFYRIVLPPRLVANCRADLSDLRIYKPDGTTVPYVLRTDVHDRMNAGYQALPDPVIRRKDSSNKHSYYWLKYDDAYRIDRLSLMVSDPMLYKRETRIMACGDSTDPVPVTSVSINPHDTAFRLPSVKARTLVIDIDNGDNPPLTITRVASAQSGIYILTHLQAVTRMGYELETGHGGDGPPDYDLHFFTDTLSWHPLDIGIQSIYIISQVPAHVPDTVAKASTSVKGPVAANRKGGLLLWSIVVIVLLLLLYVSVKMTRAIDKKEKE